MRGLVLAVIVSFVAGCASDDGIQKAAKSPEVIKATADVSKQVTRRDTDMILERGDTLEIIVRRGAGEEKYVVTVLSSGMVTVSFQDIMVQGLTEIEAEEQIRRELSKVIKNPRVQVRLAQKHPVKPKSFYIFGEVKNAGKFQLDRDATLLHALGQAAGYTDVAALDKVIVISRPQTAADNPVIRVADVDAFLKKGDLSADIPLDDNDVVFVPRDKIGDWNHYYQKAVLPALNSALLFTSALLIGKSLQVLFASPEPQAAQSPQTSVPVCWVAQVLYGDHAWQTHLLRWYVVGPLSDHLAGRWFANLYRRYGEHVAHVLADHPQLKKIVKPLFDYLLKQAIAAVPNSKHGWPPPVWPAFAASNQ